MEQGTADSKWGQTIKPHVRPVTYFSPKGPTSFVLFYETGLRPRLLKIPQSPQTVPPAKYSNTQVCGRHFSTAVLPEYAGLLQASSRWSSSYTEALLWVELGFLATRLCTSVALLPSPALNGPSQGCGTQTRLQWENEHRWSVLFKTPVSVFVNLM